MIFYDNKHKEFYFDILEKASVKDCYSKSIIYILGILSETRSNFDKIYNLHTNTLIHESIKLPFQTSGSIALTRLAFNLFNGTFYDICYTNEDTQEIANPNRYTPVELFQNKDLIICMYEGIKLRFETANENSIEYYK